MVGLSALESIMVRGKEVLAVNTVVMVISGDSDIGSLFELVVLVE